MNPNSNIYCPPHLRPGFNQQPIMSGLNIKEEPLRPSFNQNNQLPIMGALNIKEESLRPQAHDELIKYISDTWSSVIKEHGKNAYYIEQESLQDNK